MIKPEILKMVEECKRQCATCKYDKDGLCDGFGLRTGRLPDNCNEKDIENIFSFLTSQEVCEWEEVGNPEDIQYHYKTSCGHTDYRLPHPLNCLVKFCLFCGGKIKKGESK